MTTTTATRPTQTTPRAPQRPPQPPQPPTGAVSPAAAQTASPRWKPSAAPANRTTPFAPTVAGTSTGPPHQVGHTPDHPAPRPRGRHRRPRPRKLLFAVGGMALAAGALSLVRLTSDPVGGAGAVGPAPSAADDVTDGTTEAGTTVGGEPSADAGTPTADTPMGGGNPKPGHRPPSSGAPTPTPTPSAYRPAPSIGVDIPSAPGARDVPRTPPAPDTPTAPRAPEAPRPTAPAPTQPVAAAPQQPTTPDSPTTPTAPGDTTTTPTKPTKPGLCVPIVGLCVNDALSR
ncbi:hypothetical protein [Streptomyces akebiae]|uniref:Uncharacterized protein n=1 Tax=Streptomyces akebiae TaxID=2865673 RepID=A0ABX8XRG0_9ACTN|nr:hypothetical protein [Streptomyces akebiae]QYX77841.1 hypothetical protein K1J60_16040 [Streptomyces akebiae]